MIVQTHFNYKIPKEILFIECSIDNCHDDYFIPLIEEGVQREDNNSYWTNVKGKMTRYNFFNKDKILQDLIRKSIRSLPLNLPYLALMEAWGIKISKDEFTQEHKHDVAFSGILYLNDTSTTIEFPEINKSVECKKGKFLFFSGMLLHKTQALVNEVKYAIAFNCSNNIKK